MALVASAVVKSDSRHDTDKIYKPLDSSKREIRVLELLPSEEEADAIHCRLHTVSLDNDPHYIALSYV